MTSTSDLAKIRTEQNKLMADTVYVQRLTRLSDSAGGWTETWNTITTTKGRLAPSHQQQVGETVKGGAMVAFGEYILTIPSDTELQQDDRLQINGTQYEVRGILDRSEKTALRVVISKI